MAPNLYLAAKKVVSPRSWFRSSSGERLPHHFHADHPVPGIYSYNALLGLVLIARDSDNGALLPQPIQVRKCRATRQWFLKDDWAARTTHALITDPDGFKSVRLMFRLDNGISWVACEDENGVPIPGPWPLYCVNQTTGQFRLMVKGDSPEWRARLSLDHRDEDKMVNRLPVHDSREMDTRNIQPITLQTSSNASTVNSSATSVYGGAGSTRAPSPDNFGLQSPITPYSAQIMPLSLKGDYLTRELDARLTELELGDA